MPKAPRRPPRPPTAETLAKSALYYLARYAASESSLRRVLENRLRRVAIRNKEFAADKALQARLHSSIDELIARHKKSGVLNDLAYAQTKVNSLRRAGRSTRAIQQKLGYAGVPKDTIKNALVEDEDGLDPYEIELKAAQSLARRKRLGPFRVGKMDPALYRKDLASLARAGFSLTIAQQVLGGQGWGSEVGGDEGEEFGAISEK